MAAMVTVNCKCCSQPFQARVADRKRGWAKFCSKKCKAKSQERSTGVYREYLDRQDDYSVNHDSNLDAVELGWDGHKNWL